MRALSTVVAALALAAAGAQVPAHAAAASQNTNTTAKSAAATVQPVCSAAKKGQFTCFALRRTDVASAKGIQPNLTPSGYGPTDLASAYNLPPNGGAGATVALVDAYDDPNAEADLAVYRAQYGLPACTTANGCFSKVDETGGSNYPPGDSGWSGEISLDLDMVSAVAPAAHIILVEASSANFTDLGAAVDEAVALGAGYVSNSYGTGYTSTPGSGEDPSETTAMDPYYNHPGVAVVASSGDGAYGVAYPAASQYVTSVGGTSLVRDSSTRGWSESVWNNAYGGGGSGCSVYEPKPSFQTDTGCANRTVADVSAVADPVTGVAVYDSYQASGWQVFGGTSASSPIIASVYADAGSPAAGTYPNSYPYAAASSSLNDVTSGSNGTCTPAYYCTAEVGYDGPTGLGTPNGVAAFTSGPHGFVKGTVTATGGTPLAGAKVTVGTSTVTTAADGTYTLSVPAGTYDVSVSDFGYASSTVTAVAVADGATVTENFTLAAVARVTVAGTVADGSGKGWPLYSTITVDGAPGGPVYTNPKTGAYSLQLPVNASYTLKVTAAYPGYQPTSQTVAVGTSDLTQNISVPVDAAGCTAAGYTLNSHGLYQSFGTTATPSGWTVSNASGTAGGWEFDDPGHRGNQTGGSGGFAIVDSDHTGPGLSQDSTLTSPVVDLSANSAPALSFDTYYFQYYNSVASVDVSVDGGATWSNVWQYTTTGVYGQHVSIPLPQAADQSAVQVRFHYTGQWAYYWQLDNVLIGYTTCDPVPGGLVVGQVTDANTGGALAGAAVSVTGAGSATGTSAISADPAFTGAFYWLFSPSTGSQTLTAAKGHYTTGTAAVNIAASGVTEADFSLKAGQLAISPASVSKSLAWGASGTAKVTVTNTGTAPATLNLSESTGGFTIQGVQQSQAPVQHVTGVFPKTDLAVAAKAAAKSAVTPKAASPTAGTSWTPIADYPTTIQDNLAEYYGGKLYSGFGYNGSADTSTFYSYDPSAGAWTQLASAADTRETPAHGFIGGKLYVAGGWGPSGAPDTNTEVYDPAGNTWSAGPAWSGAVAGAGSAVVGSKLYVIGGCGASSCGSTTVSVLDTSTGTWSTAAAYPEAIAWSACGTISGKIYCGGGTTDSAATAHTYSYDPSTDTWTKLADMPAAIWGTAYTAANGELLAQDGVSGGALTNQGNAYDPATNAWTALPNGNAAAYRFGGALGFYTVGGGQGFGSTPLSSANVLAGYDQSGNADVPWLTESATSVTLAPGKSASVTLTFNAADASVVQPGSYTATLLADSDTPYRISSVPVTMTVANPKTWGEIAGVVQYTNASGALVPIAGATVQIDTWAASYTLHTDTTGAYALWLDVRNNPLTVIAAKDGYQPQAITVKIKKGKTVIETFTLLKD